MATEEAARVWAAAEPVYFYRRGADRHWYQTSAEHIDTIRRLKEETYAIQVLYARPDIVIAAGAPVPHGSANE